MENADSVKDDIFVLFACCSHLMARRCRGPECPAVGATERALLNAMCMHECPEHVGHIAIIKRGYALVFFPLGRTLSAAGFFESFAAAGTCTRHV